MCNASKFSTIAREYCFQGQFARYVESKLTQYQECYLVLFRELRLFSQTSYTPSRCTKLSQLDARNNPVIQSNGFIGPIKNTSLRDSAYRPLRVADRTAFLCRRHHLTVIFTTKVSLWLVARMISSDLSSKSRNRV